MELVDQFFVKFKTPKGKPKDSDFKKMFLEYCQKKLQARENDILLIASKSEEDEILMLKKERIMGSVRLIAELFIRGAVPDDYVKASLDRLFKKTMDDNVESAVALLQGIGKKLYEYFAFEAKLTTLTKKPKLTVKKLTKEIIDDYIDKLLSLKHSDAVSSKAKFAIQDLVDARDKVWNAAFNQFPVSKQVVGKTKEDIVAYRKKSKNVPEESPKEQEESKAAPEIPGNTTALEQSTFGKSLEKYNKSKLDEKVRVHFIFFTLLLSHSSE